MKNDETWSYALRELTRRKGRILSSVAAYVIAITVLLTLINWFSYAKDVYLKELMEVGAHFIAYMPTDDAYPQADHLSLYESFYAANSNTKLFSVDFVKKMDGEPSVFEATSYVSFRFMNKNDNFPYMVGGFDPTRRISFGTPVCAPGDLVEGRFLTADDRGVAMVEQDFALARGIRVGGEITVGNELFEVIGFVRPAVRPGRANLYIHIEDTDRVITDYTNTPFNHRENVNVILVEAANAPSYGIASKKAKEYGFEFFGYGCHAPAAGAMGMIADLTLLLILIIGIGTILYSAKSQHSSVMERRHDIGILKSIGWSNKRLVKQIIGEAILQSVIGGIIGTVISIIVVYAVPFSIIAGFDKGVQIHYLWHYIPVALILSITAGIVSSIFPALASARKSPAEALRFN